ncbi:MAG TPA: saccharopine dehydrogenase NADP-binding domain-containing protein, partial [Mycobacteriales bacterium]
MTRDHDVVLYGATGYVGALIADYLAYAAPSGTKIALAGRNLQKLEQLRAALPEAARDWPLLVADTGDPAAVQAMAASTNVLATTVGPYAKYGVPVVAACARSGTHYADLTGEPLFHRDMIDTYGKEAADTGAKIVHSCGYDSIPSDLGVL